VHIQTPVIGGGDAERISGVEDLGLGREEPISDGSTPFKFPAVGWR